jgi:hypothetical protein
MSTARRAADAATAEPGASDRWLRTGRREAPLEFKFNPNHDPATGQFTSAPGIRLTPESAAMADRIASGFFLRTGKRLRVTSGTRSSEKQATAMLNKGPETWQSLYRDKTAVQQIRAAHDQAIEAGEGRAGAITAMAQIIRQQEKVGRYVSRHLLSHALDLSIQGLSPSEQAILGQEAQRHDGKIIPEGGREPHIHVQF